MMKTPFQITLGSVSLEDSAAQVPAPK